MSVQLHPTAFAAFSFVFIVFFLFFFLDSPHASVFIWPVLELFGASRDFAAAAIASCAAAAAAAAAAATSNDVSSSSRRTAEYRRSHAANEDREGRRLPCAAAAEGYICYWVFYQNKTWIDEPKKREFEVYRQIGIFN